MKKFTKVVFLLLIVAMVVTSCSKPEAPTIPELPLTEDQEEVVDMYNREIMENIPVRISEDNPLDNPTCIPEYQWLEKIHYHIGEKLQNGEYEFGVWKTYCEQGIYPKLSFNAKILEIKGDNPTDWIYNLNQPNIVKPWVKPLYSLLFEEKENQYSLHLGKTYRSALVTYRYSNDWYHYSSYISGKTIFDRDMKKDSNYSFIEEDQEIRLIIFPFDFLIGEVLDNGTYFIDEMNIERGFFPIIEYENNFFFQEGKDELNVEVFVSRGIGGLVDNRDSLNFKPKLIQDPSWSKPRWAVDFSDYYGKVPIVYTLNTEKFWDITQNLAPMEAKQIREEKDHMTCFDLKLAPYNMFHSTYTEMLSLETDYLVLTDSYGRQVYLGTRDSMRIEFWPVKGSGWLEWFYGIYGSPDVFIRNETSSVAIEITTREPYQWRIETLPYRFVFFNKE